MSLIEGGSFHCYIHDVDATSMTEWNAHCDDGTHFDEGTSTCIDCNTPIKFKVPYVPYKEDGTKGVREKYALRCEACSAKVGSAEVSTI